MACFSMSIVVIRDICQTTLLYHGLKYVIVTGPSNVVAFFSVDLSTSRYLYTVVTDSTMWQPSFDLHHTHFAGGS